MPEDFCNPRAEAGFSKYFPRTFSGWDLSVLQGGRRLANTICELSPFLCHSKFLKMPITSVIGIFTILNHRKFTHRPSFQVQLLICLNSTRTWAGTSSSFFRIGSYTVIPFAKQLSVLGFSSFCDNSIYCSSS